MTSPHPHRGASIDDVIREAHRDEGRRLNFERIKSRRGWLRRLREERAAAGLTQAEVAESMGVGQSTVSELEGERDDMYVSTLQRYASAVGGRIELVFLKDDERVRVVTELDDEIEHLLGSTAANRSAPWNVIVSRFAFEETSEIISVVPMPVRNFGREDAFSWRRRANAPMAGGFSPLLDSDMAGQ